MKKALIIAALLLSLSLQGIAQSASPHYLLALSKNDHTLAMVDPATLKVVAKVPVGPDPHEVVSSADGRTAYVSNYAGGSLHELDIIDLVNKKALTPVDTKPLIGLHGLYFAAGKVWFTAEGSKTVGRYDPQTGKVDWAMGTGQDRTHMLHVTPDGKHIYTTNVSSGTVSILEEGARNQEAGGRTGNPPPPPGGNPRPGFGPPPGPHENWEQTIIPVSRGSEGFDVSPDGRQLWTAVADDGSIAVIDLAAKKVVTRIDAKVLGANRLAFTPDGKRVLVSSLRDGNVTVFDVATQQPVKTISTGHGAAGILVAPDGSRAFIGCTPDNYVAVIDLQSLTVVAHVDVGGGPDGLAWGW
jgi:YVTN family beta-propeller protein